MFLADRLGIGRQQDTYYFTLDTGAFICRSLVTIRFFFFKILTRVVNSYFNSETKYHPQVCEDTARKVSVNVKRACKGLSHPRYKIAAVTTIGEKNEQCCFSMCKFLWDADLDVYSTYTFENQYLFVIATVYMLYYE